ncbi:MAG: DNA topoisomerase IV subunit A [Lentisphaerae bacterium]|nr:DNA topoisomerase IV subunit A [Lentisphaerota bacterium]
MSSPDDNNIPTLSQADDSALDSQSAPAAEDALHDLVSHHFIEYASYVIKERAIPDVDDGLKPVQRRILHTLHTIDDGRFNKVATTVGATMQFHPHGDASITDALVVLANKKYFIETQGNFGNILTGDPASAARYIECRLTPLAKEVLFNKQTTTYVDSYDGRNREPVCLPSKVPTLLMLGADGIAVGMRTQIFPHNFKELLKAQIAILENKPFQVYPDFPQGGIIDVSEYEDGAGRIKVRAKIEAEGDKKLIIREIPAYTTTESLIDSISRAVRAGKLKISSINDYTAENVEIELNLGRGVYAKETIKELYAYTHCEQNLRSTLLVICDNMPVEMTVSEVLRRNSEKLLELLRRELELELQAREDSFHNKSLERIFIENRIYKKIETCDSLEKIFKVTHAGLARFRHLLHRDIVDEDIERLLQIHIRRISLFDLNRNKQELDEILLLIEQSKHNLENLTAYAIDLLQKLLEKYGPLFPRLSIIDDFKSVDPRAIARADLKVYHDRLGYFVGSNVKPSNKNDEPLLCTEFDHLMLLKNDGLCKVIQVSDKEYIGPTKYVFLLDKQQEYSILYRDRQEGTWYAKRFMLDQYTLGREYNILPPNCIIEQLYTNKNVIVQLDLEHNRRRSYNSVKVEFAAYALRSREARGFKLTHYPVTGITVLDRGLSKEKIEAKSDQDDKPVKAEVDKENENIAPKPAIKKKTPPKTTEKNNAKAAAPVDIKVTEPVEKTEAEPVDKPAAATPNISSISAPKVDKPEEPPAVPAPKPKPKPEEKPEDAEQLDAESKKPMRKLVDEDTPFFLE